MENIAYIALSHQTALKRQMQMTANNVANMSTPAFKAQDILFNEYLVEPEKSDALSMVLDFGTFRRIEQGPMQRTENPLDVAIQGNGYFVVDTGEQDGERYTRAGNFALNDRSELVTQNGHKVMGDGGPILIPEGDSNIMINKDGTVSTRQSGIIGKLRTVRFDNDQNLLEEGNNLYRADKEDLEPATDITLYQGMLEGSNVQPIKEMNRMIEISRAYQSTQNLIKTDHDRQRSAISQLTRPSN